MNMERPPRPGVWGDDARPGEIVRVRDDGVPVFNVGATFIPLWGENHKKRRAFRLE